MKYIEKINRGKAKEFYLIRLSKEELKFLDFMLNMLHKNVFRFFPKTSDKAYGLGTMIKTRSRVMRKNIKEIFEREKDELKNVT